MGQWTCKSETMSELGDEISREREERIKEILGNVKYNPLFDSVPLHETVAQPSFLERLDWGGGEISAKGIILAKYIGDHCRLAMTECFEKSR